VESSIAVDNEMNFDFYSLADATDEQIIIRHDIRLLFGWPEWASPPKREDMLECSVELISLSRAEVT